MNELQQILLVVAAMIIAGLYFFSKRNVAKDKNRAQNSIKSFSHVNTETRISEKEKTEEKDSNFETPAQFGTEANLSEQTPLKSVQSDASEVRAHIKSHGAAFSDPSPVEVKTTEVKSEVVQSTSTSDEYVSVENAQTPMESIEAPEAPSFFEDAPSEEKTLATSSQHTVEKTEPEAYVIIVMSTGRLFDMTAVNHALLGVGLIFDETQQLYVKKDINGTSIITVANLLEPGIFPTENIEQYTTPGVVLILQLPTTIKAPRAMNDLITMSRKISQRLNGRLYNMDRQLIKESDLQVMRDAAIAYETQPF